MAANGVWSKGAWAAAGALVCLGVLGVSGVDVGGLFGARSLATVAGKEGAPLGASRTLNRSSNVGDVEPVFKREASSNYIVKGSILAALAENSPYRPSAGMLAEVGAVTELGMAVVYNPTTRVAIVLDRVGQLHVVMDAQPGYWRHEERVVEVEASGMKLANLAAPETKGVVRVPLKWLGEHAGVAGNGDVTFRVKLEGRGESVPVSLPYLVGAVRDARALVNLAAEEN